MMIILRQLLVFSVALVIINTSAVINATVVYSDNYNGNPESYSLPPDGINYQFFAPNTQTFTNVTSTGSRFSFATDNGEINYNQGGFFNNFGFSTYKALPGIWNGDANFFEIFPIEAGQTIRQTTRVKVETSSRFNNVSGIDDFDLRRGNLLIAFVALNFGQTFCFMVSGTEVFLLQDSVGAQLGFPFEQFNSWDKLIDKEQDDIFDLTAEYDSVANKMRWYIDGVLMKEHTPGTPAGFVGRKYDFAGAPIPNPIPMLNNFVLITGHIHILDFLGRGESSAPVRLGDKLTYLSPTSFTTDSYDCFELSDRTTPLAVKDQDAYCPVLDGYDIKSTLYKLKIEVFQ